MKHLFFVAVTSGIFSACTITSKAQTAVGTVPLSGRAQSKTSFKFIESIEIKSAVKASSGTVPNQQIEPEGLRVDPLLITNNGTSANIEQCSLLQFKYAMLMDTEVETITNISLYKFINSWWATPYKFGGNDSNGIDCSAFAGKLLSAVYGLNVPRTVSDQYKLCEELDTKELAEGDLVFFNTGGGINHVGLYLGNSYFVHSSVHDGVTISSLKDQYYSSRFVAGGRIPSTPAPLAP